MNHDDEASLLLYLYHELDADERAALERRLSADPLLRVQLSELRRDLQHIDQVLIAPQATLELDEGFEARMWQKLEPKLLLAASDQASDARRILVQDHQAAPQGRRTSRFRQSLSWAATVLAALGLGLWLGARNPAPALDGDKLLAAQLGAHLRSTEQVFLLAQHDPQSGQLAAALAANLMDSHRLYAAAAERAGRPQLAHALREMEPALLELSTSPEHTVDALLQQAITEADLPFKARSAAWAVQHIEATAPRPRG